MTLALELARSDAVAQAELVHRGDLTAAELVEATIERIELVNPRLGAVVSTSYEHARRDARSATGPLAGVGVVLKDGISESADDLRSEGLRVLRDAGWRDGFDSYLTARLRRAGAAICGRANQSPLATGAVTASLHGVTRNPWDLARSAGGSSGGSAAAVAAGMVPLATGSDMGGSIRVPASMCGVVGLKPSRGRTSFGPSRGECWASLGCQHVLARTVRDTALALDLLAGPEPGDPYWAEPPVRSWRSEVGRPSGRLHVGLAVTPFEGDEPVHPECRRAAERTVGRLDELGHRVVDVDVSPIADEAALGSRRILMAVAVASEVERWSRALDRPLTAGDLEPSIWSLVEEGRRCRAVDHAAAVDAMHAYGRRVATVFAEVEVLVTPTVPMLPPRLDASDPGSVSRFTAPFNLSGQPAISLPLHWSPEGLPVGVQLVARPAREDVLIRLSAQLEDADPWAARVPAVSAFLGR